MGEDETDSQLGVAIELAVCEGQFRQHPIVRCITFRDAIEADQQDVTVTLQSDAGTVVSGGGSGRCHD